MTRLTVLLWHRRGWESCLQVRRRLRFSYGGGKRLPAQKTGGLYITQADTARGF